MPARAPVNAHEASPLGAGNIPYHVFGMKITILETGRPPDSIAEHFPTYPEMIESLISRVDSGFSYETLSLVEGAAADPAALGDAVAITGSPCGVYDHTPWMDPLRDLIRRVAEVRRPMVGICFGHQIIADALGGDVRKSEKGWGVGRHTYEILYAEPWMTDAGTAFSLSASHQDQVITPPAGARTLARSAHTDHALLSYDFAPIVSMQGHPEFADAFSVALYNARRGRGLSDEAADAAVESMAVPEDNELVAEWIARFMRTAR